MTVAKAKAKTKKEPKTSSSPQTHSLTFLGIRHHGPGSARSVLNALAHLKPDLVLLEGPADADALIPLIKNPQMKPPVALLLYATENLSKAVFYPFTIFSPEWQTLHYALSQKIPIHFMDLPQHHQLALNLAEEVEETEEAEERATPSEAGVSESSSEAPPAEARAEDQVESDVESEQDDSDSEGNALRDPLDYLAQAAGFDDGERWWEFMVEQRPGSLEVFQGVQEAITALRQQLENDQLYHTSPRERLREAWMRSRIRKAQEEGYQNIVVVCGAWHIPALAIELEKVAKDDQKLLEKLPSCNVEATWIPWSHGRISYHSGYGAGINAPGWYQHLWDSEECGEKTQETPSTENKKKSASPSRSHSQTRPKSSRPERITSSWLSKVASLLREEDIPVSTASVIEAVRLSNTVAALRGKPLPDLEELNEAVISIFCFGDEVPLKFIYKRLILGEKLGEVPKDIPCVPLQRDLERLQKGVLEAKAEMKEIAFDLRESLGLERSKLLHRLKLLNIPWGTLLGAGSRKGTFKESWQIQWKPEFVIHLIEASLWGNTVEEAATRYTIQRLQETTELAEITRRIDEILLADLPEALEAGVSRLNTEAALANDLYQLMAALPPLATVMRYSNVRQIGASTLVHVVDTLVTRICIGLTGACSSLDDDAAENMFNHLVQTQSALSLMQNEEYLQLWGEVLQKLVRLENLHGLVAGRAYRLLLELHKIDPQEAAQQFSLALSTANDPLKSAGWIDGLLRESALLLLHGDQIWSILEEWLTHLRPEAFINLLPLLRRTFSSFSSAERRQMGERVKHGILSPSKVSSGTAEFDPLLAQRVLPLVSQMLGLSYSPSERK
jgi:hypothetical protein